MLFYRWTDQCMRLTDGTAEWELPVPVPPAAQEHPRFYRPHISKTGRYVAVPIGQKIFLYDTAEQRQLVSPGSFKDRVFDVRFDAADRLYYIEGSRIGRWTIGRETIDPLYSLGRVVHGPERLGVSPDGRFVSFCRYRSGGDYFFSYDTEREVCTDHKFSLYHYVWLDDTHVVWSLNGGVKLLDAKSGKKTTLVKDWQAVAKKALPTDSARLSGLEEKNWPSGDLDLLGGREGTVYFSLCAYWFRHDGADTKLVPHHHGCWALPPNSKRPVFCYDLPQNRALKWQLLPDGRLCAADAEALYLYDGSVLATLGGSYRPALAFDSRNA